MKILTPSTIDERFFSVIQTQNSHFLNERKKKIETIWKNEIMEATNIHIWKRPLSLDRYQLISSPSSSMFEEQKILKGIFQIFFFSHLIGISVFCWTSLSLRLAHWCEFICISLSSFYLPCLNVIFFTSVSVCVFAQDVLTFGSTILIHSARTGQR